MKLICGNCGHEKFTLGTVDRDERCEICGKKMQLESDVETNNLSILESAPENKIYSIKDIIDMDLVSSIEDTIVNVGNDRTWESIEKIINAKQRLAFRQAFLKAGGTIPNSSI